MNKLTPTQEIVLKAAADRESGSIYPMPENIKGGAAAKVTDALKAKMMVDADGIITRPGVWAIDSHWSSPRAEYLDEVARQEYLAKEAEANATTTLAIDDGQPEENEPAIEALEAKEQPTEEATTTALEADEAQEQPTEEAITTALEIDEAQEQPTDETTALQQAFDEADAAYEVASRAACKADDELNKAIRKGKSKAIIEQAREQAKAAWATTNQAAEAAMSAQAALEASRTTAMENDEAQEQPLDDADSDLSTTTALDADEAQDQPDEPQEDEALPAPSESEIIIAMGRLHGVASDLFKRVVEEALERAFKQGADSTTRKAKPARQPTAPKTPRADSKQARVIAMMQRPEGATLAQIAEATGWQNHTIRAFISTSKKKGLEIASNHLRVIGPNQPGSPGSVTSYCIG